MSTAINNEHQRQRQLSFCPRPDQSPADLAVLILGSFPGVQSLVLLDRNRIDISYNLLETSLDELLEQLTNAGLEVAGSLMERISRALCIYTEGVQRENLGIEPRYRSAFTRKIFIQRYQKLDHQCRDTRPDVWRQYR